MPLPNFFVIGAARSGTTALHATLAQHPDIFMSPNKEPYFFAFEGQPPPAPQGPPHGGIVWQSHKYLALFKDVSGERAIGESSIIYLSSSVAARRIRRNVPEAKIAALLRNPVERAYSQYCLMVWYGFERAPTFEAALAEEPARVAAGWWPTYLYTTYGLYHRALIPWFELFPRERIRIYLYEDWRQSPQATLRDLFGFLGVDPDFEPQLRDINAARIPRSRIVHRLARGLGIRQLERFARQHHLIAPPPMRSDTRRMLLARCRDDIICLQDLIGRDLSGWLVDRECCPSS